MRVFPAQAQTRVWLSGYVDMSIKHLRSSGPGSTTRMSSGGLNNSRFNLSGVEELGDGNKAIFTIEPTFSANNGQQAAQFRQSFVGLKGAWGELTLGRQFTPSYWIAGYADPTWAAEFSMVNNMQFFYAPYRTDGAVQYKTPAFHGLSGRFMMSNGEGDSSKADVSSAPRWSTAKARCSWAWPASNNTRRTFSAQPGALLPRQLPVRGLSHRRRGTHVHLPFL